MVSVKVAYEDCKKAKNCQHLWRVSKVLTCPSLTYRRAHSYIYLIRYIHDFYSQGRLILGS